MFLVCGEALFDAFMAAPEPTGSVALQARPGGSPFNVAIGLARMGVETGFVGGISRDAFGPVLISRLRAEGVSDRFLARKDRPTTLSVVSVGEDGQPAYSFYGGDSADVSLLESDLPPLPAGLEGLHFGSYTMIVRPVADTFKALAARAQGTFISYDANVRLNVAPDPGLWWETIKGMAALVTLLKISAEDIESIRPGAVVEDVARDVADLGPALVVLTNGAEGAVAFRGDSRIAVPAAPVSVIDTVGAGDAFQAQLIAALRDHGALETSRLRALDEAAISEVLRRATMAAAITCGRVGADPPSRADLQDAGAI